MFVSKQDLQEVVTARPQAKDKLRLFARVKENTFAKLERSLSDLEGRYVSSHAYANPKPSQNWKVVKQGKDSIQGDTLEVWLKVGIMKAVIDAQGNTTKRYDVDSARAFLTEMRDWVASLEEGTDASEDFHKLAVTASTPKSKPKTDGHNDWEYNRDEGQFESYYNPNK